VVVVISTFIVEQPLLLLQISLGQTNNNKTNSSVGWNIAAASICLGLSLFEATLIAFCLLSGGAFEGDFSTTAIR